MLLDGQQQFATVIGMLMDLISYQQNPVEPCEAEASQNSSSLGVKLMTMTAFSESVHVLSLLVPVQLCWALHLQ